MSSIFISYNHSDKPFVQSLSNHLRNLGVSIWIDEAEIKIGDSLIEKIRDGIDRVDFVAVVLSSHSVNSSWVRKEVDIAMNQEIEGKRVKVLPLLIDDCDPPGFLKGKLYADFRDPTFFDREFRKLAERLGMSDVVNLSGQWQAEYGLGPVQLTHASNNITGEYVNPMYAVSESAMPLTCKLSGIIKKKMIFYEWEDSSGRRGIGYWNITNSRLTGFWYKWDGTLTLANLSDNPDAIKKHPARKHQWDLVRFGKPESKNAEKPT